MENNFQIVGKRIKEIRKRVGWSQATLAEAAGISVQYMSQIETASKRPSLVSLLNISKALGVTLDEILLGNQVIRENEYHSDIWGLLLDCNRYERRVLYEMLAATKEILRGNEGLQ